MKSGEKEEQVEEEEEAIQPGKKKLNVMKDEERWSVILRRRNCMDNKEVEIENDYVSPSLKEMKGLCPVNNNVSYTKPMQDQEEEP